MRVLEREQDRVLAGETLELIEQCRQRSAALLRGAERQRRIPLAGRDRQHRSKNRGYALYPRGALGEGPLQFRQAFLGAIVALATCPSLHFANARAARPP